MVKKAIQIKNSIRSFLPAFKNSQKRNKSDYLKKNSSDYWRESYSYIDLSRRGIHNSKQTPTTYRRQLSNSAPVSVQNTPVVRHKYSGDRVLNPATFYPRVSNPPGTSDKIKTQPDIPSENRPKGENSGGKYSVSSMKKPSFESKFDSSDIKASDIRFADYIQQRKQSQKKIAPPSPKPKKTIQKGTEETSTPTSNRTAKLQKSLEETSTPTSSQTSPKLTAKNPCNWSKETGPTRNYNTINKSVSSPATPILSERKQRNKQTPERILRLEQQNSYSVTPRGESIKGFTNDSSKVDGVIQQEQYVKRFPPTSPTPKRRSCHARTMGSPNLARRKYQEAQSSIEENGEGVQHGKYSSNSPVSNGTKSVETNYRLYFKKASIPEKKFSRSQKETVSLPCTPYQGRKFPRPSNSFEPIQNSQTRPLSIINQPSSIEENNQNNDFLLNTLAIDKNVETPAKTTLPPTSPRMRKKNSVLTPEQTYAKQRLSDVPAAVTSVPQYSKNCPTCSPPQCRKVSRILLSSSNSGSKGTNDNEHDSIANEKSLATFDIQQIYQFVADAQTQTDDTFNINSDSTKPINATKPDSLPVNQDNTETEHLAAFFNSVLPASKTVPTLIISEHLSDTDLAAPVQTRPSSELIANYSSLSIPSLENVIHENKR